MSNVRDLLERATAELADAGCQSPRNDAELLLSHVLKIDRRDLIKLETMTADAFVAYMALITKRCRREPLQHLTGQAHFRHLTLHVGKGVFIPRPETELLVQASLDELAKIDGPKLAVDLCSGSGAIALSLALESPNTTVHAVEVSAEAFSWLEKNVSAYAEQLARIGSSVITYNDDATDEKVLEKFAGQVDVVISNPPYIPDAMIPREPEVQKYEPVLALFGGEDGLDIARKVAHVAAHLLKPGGMFGMEHADVQSQSALQLLEQMTNHNQPLWANIVDRHDYNELPRFVTATRTSFSSLGAI